MTGAMNARASRALEICKFELGPSGIEPVFVWKRAPRNTGNVAPNGRPTALAPVTILDARGHVVRVVSSRFTILYEFQVWVDPMTDGVRRPASSVARSGALDRGDIAALLKGAEDEYQYVRCPVRDGVGSRAPRVHERKMRLKRCLSILRTSTRCSSRRAKYRAALSSNGHCATRAG
jgi:hypothetical protein